MLQNGSGTHFGVSQCISRDLATAADADVPVAAAAAAAAAADAWCGCSFI